MSHAAIGLCCTASPASAPCHAALPCFQDCGCCRRSLLLLPPLQLGHAALGLLACCNASTAARSSPAPAMWRQRCARMPPATAQCAREVPRLTGVRHGDVVDLIGVQPDLAQAAAQHRGRQPLLQLERHLQQRASSVRPWSAHAQRTGSAAAAQKVTQTAANKALPLAAGAGGTAALGPQGRRQSSAAPCRRRRSHRCPLLPCAAGFPARCWQRRLPALPGPHAGSARLAGPWRCPIALHLMLGAVHQSPGRLGAAARRESHGARWQPAWGRCRRTRLLLGAAERREQRRGRHRALQRAAAQHPRPPAACSPWCSWASLHCAGKEAGAGAGGRKCAGGCCVLGSPCRPRWGP